MKKINQMIWFIVLVVIVLGLSGLQMYRHNICEESSENGKWTNVSSVYYGVGHCYTYCGSGDKCDIIEYEEAKSIVSQMKEGGKEE